MNRTAREWMLSLVVACWFGTARSEEATRRTEDVVYGRKCGMALTMDVF